MQGAVRMYACTPGPVHFPSGERGRNVSARLKLVQGAPSVRVGEPGCHGARAGPGAGVRGAGRQPGPGGGGRGWRGGGGGGGAVVCGGGGGRGPVRGARRRGGVGRDGKGRALSGGPPPLPTCRDAGPRPSLPAPGFWPPLQVPPPPARVPALVGLCSVGPCQAVAWLPVWWHARERHCPGTDPLWGGDWGRHCNSCLT